MLHFLFVLLGSLIDVFSITQTGRQLISTAATFILCWLALRIIITKLYFQTECYYQIRYRSH